MIAITFTSECPYCSKSQTRCIATNVAIEGDYVDLCSECGKRYLIHWILLADAEMMKISGVNPPMLCKADVDEYLPEDDEWIDEEEEEKEIEA